MLLHQHNGRIIAIPHVDMHSGNARTRTLAESLLFYRSMNVDHGLGAARTLTSPTRRGPRAVSNPDAVKRAQAHRLLTGHGSLAARRGEHGVNENQMAQHRWLAQHPNPNPNLIP